MNDRSRAILSKDLDVLLFLVTAADRNVTTFFNFFSSCFAPPLSLKELLFLVTAREGNVTTDREKFEAFPNLEELGRRVCAKKMRPEFMTIHGRV